MAQNIGANSIAIGDGTIAAAKDQIVIGSFNNPDFPNSKNPNKKGEYAFILGNGTNEEARSNALTIDWSGNIITNGTIQTKINNNIINFLTEASLASKKTSDDDLKYNSDTAHTIIPTINTIAFWNGQYNSNSSNLKYCNLGKFGTMATKDANYYHKLDERGTEILSNSDLNNYFTPGIYYCPNASVASSLSNCPWASSNFKLIVYKAGYSNSYIQEIHAGSGYTRFFKRNKIDNTISPWREELTIDPISRIVNTTGLALTEGWTSYGFTNSDGKPTASVQSSALGGNRLIFNQYKNTGTKTDTTTGAITENYNFFDRYLLPSPPTNDTGNYDNWYSILTTNGLWKYFKTDKIESDGTASSSISTSGVPIMLLARVISTDETNLGEWALKPLQTAAQSFNLSLNNLTYNATIAYGGYDATNKKHKTIITATRSSDRKYEGYILVIPSPF